MSRTRPEPSRRAFVAAGLGAGALLAAQAAPSHSQTRSSKMEATIRTGSDIATLVNVFTVEPDNQQKLVQLLKEGTETFFSKQPGFISSSGHASKEGRRAINYSQWASAGDIENFRKDPRFAPYIQRLTALSKAETILCEVVEVNHA
ncbi:antibiotic biosynthesis monooxygenase family protein [Bradyrhizobium japonicum]|uniref:antibiotic biosynthesis monooxygenase family protein n=1 Tax=Bradyrhizobium japonicum TaxID=375 RepID=UPI0020A12A75|nr:antibiotic biosynthesis monooxygenase [Bradyrhizobium japonicum]MCP1760474.1 quinol monooxygenase YgiN [Bradyrhizobium japonicum]MCP1792065.1 quinol monooxygenase YgiN [Bradyrhizobium japonicum]MCP1804488.1 quinol monooxygenase YgiN [Bradyrhizobium japonicum]MCP1813510.1 quinol monooxygenase YgiN [Bradyrhizobium japonicum]MCP1875070.1 quinol monooxygenase YgiN [Bradyrhizobium japonicum]